MAFAIQTEFVEANGLRFEVLTCGEGETLALCLHGFPETALSWREQMPVLASMGFRVWAPEQRGYGRSSRPKRMRDYDLEPLMADVAGLIDASGAKRVVLLGHDWGGIVAWTFATRRVRPLARMVIINVPHPVPFARSLWRGQIFRSWYAFFFQIPLLPEWILSIRGAWLVGEVLRRTSRAPGGFPLDVLRAIRANAAEPGALKAMIDWYRAFLIGGGLARQMRKGFPAFETPTLLLWGDADLALAKYTTDGTGEFALDLKLQFLPGVSHWVQQDAPALCNAALLEFLTPVVVAQN